MSLPKLAVIAGMIVASTASFTPPLKAVPIAPSETSVAQNKRLMSEAFARWTAGGTDFFEILAPDVIWTIKGSGPSAGRFVGRADFLAKAVRPFVGRLSTPVRPVATRIWADGDHVIANWDGEAVARDGMPYRNSYVWIMRMQSGKVVEATALLDLVAYDAVLRRVPAPTGPSDGHNKSGADR